jgi:hypothetical protein
MLLNIFVNCSISAFVGSHASADYKDYKYCILTSFHNDFHFHVDEVIIVGKTEYVGHFCIYEISRYMNITSETRIFGLRLKCRLSYMLGILSRVQR